MATNVGKLYETRPLQSWQKAKELRTNTYKEVQEARQAGRLIAFGGVGSLFSLVRGIGEFSFLRGENYGAVISHDVKFSALCSEAMECRGFARDMCAYTKNFLGSMFLDKYAFGGNFPKPNFCIQAHSCDSHAKWFQYVSEYFNVPYFCIDVPAGNWENNPSEYRVKYMVGEMEEAIEWLEKVTHRKYDDEKLIEAVTNECTCSSLWAEVCLMNRAVPAPLDQRTILGLLSITAISRHTPEAVELLKFLRDEVRQRVDDGMAALPTERFRILDDRQPLWHFLDIYNHLNKYGAIAIGSFYSFTLTGSYDEQEDGTWVALKPPEERGIHIKDRETALRILASEEIMKRQIEKVHLPSQTNKALLMMVKEWSCQGVMMHFNRGCELNSSGAAENRLALREAGVPVFVYEGSMADRRDADISEITKRMDVYMEQVGLNIIK